MITAKKINIFSLVLRKHPQILLFIFLIGKTSGVN